MYRLPLARRRRGQVHMSAGGRGSPPDDAPQPADWRGGEGRRGNPPPSPLGSTLVFLLPARTLRGQAGRSGLPALTARPRRAVWWCCRRRPPAAPGPSATLPRCPLVRERGFVVPSRPRRPPPPPLPAPARPPAIGGGGGARGARGTAAVAAAKRVWRPQQTITTAKVGAAVRPWRASSIGCAAGAGPPTLAGRPTGGCASLTRPPQNTRATRATSCGRPSTGG